MSTYVEVTFQIEGRYDGPLAPDIIESGMTPEQMADKAARELKALLLDEMDGTPDLTARVNVRATARLHEVDERTGHAEQ